MFESVFEFSVLFSLFVYSVSLLHFLKNIFIYLTASGLSCGMQDLSLRCADSLTVVRQLSCSTTCGILVPQPGIKPVSPALESRFLTTGPPGKSLHCFCYCSFILISKGIYLPNLSSRFFWLL